MKLSELIAAVGDENIEVQHLAECVKDLKQRKDHGEISFVTAQENTHALIHEASGGQQTRVGMVLWFDRERWPGSR